MVALEIELAIKSIDASSGQWATSITANSESGEHIGITAPFEKASENNNVFHVSNVKDDTRNNIPDKASELSVPETSFVRQPLTHHISFHMGYCLLKILISIFQKN